MPTIFTHALVAGAVGGMATDHRRPLRFWFLLVACSLLPDADVIGLHLGVSYEHYLGHRGFFHSPAFAWILSIAVMVLFFRDVKPFSRRWWVYFLCFFGVGASHGVLDAFTDGGLGIALFVPFSEERYFFPWTPLEVSPISVQRFFSSRGWTVLISEILWVWLPVLSLWGMVRFIRRSSTAPSPPDPSPDS